ncbi:hypothetical protein N0O92_05805 [Alkalihalobacillus sp. MEB130]|uniref:hypothetical protein n=1 Tax=Alkalihalobacillus sp. MEB130 TaxID=2976704 RepID=UPI0028DFDBB0|nr:hypothetical protein [Alkalihalobacillus sp. MEB130]MDT8859741.1 hypothetical protein [Alkalihalobacillus sp. MEB130]
MSYIHENGWFLFVISEGLTWVLIVFFLLSRYWLRFDRLSQMWLIFIVGINIFQIFLGGIDFYFTGEISFFQIVIVLFITYACTLGSSDFARLDQFIKKKFDRGSRNVRVVEEKREFKKHVTYRYLLFAFHTGSFLGLHLIWYIVERNHFHGIAEYIVLLSKNWFEPVSYVLLENSLYFVISYVWILIYLFDLIVIMSYFAFVLFWNNKQNSLS